MKARVVVCAGVTVIGALLLLVGLIVGFRPLTYWGADCGSAFRGEWSRSIACDDVRSMVSLVAWPLIVVGGLTALGGALAWVGAVAPDDEHTSALT